jgi:hypothetical protein
MFLMNLTYLTYHLYLMYRQFLMNLTYPMFQKNLMYLMIHLFQMCQMNH